MDEQEERLRQLIAAACQHPDGSKERQKAMHPLLIVVQTLPEFRKYSGLDCPDYFLDALNRTWEWFGRNLREFQPRTASTRTDLVKWLNGYLYWRLKDLNSPSNDISLDETILDSDSGEIATWLERVSQEGQLLGTPSNPRVLDGLEIYLEQQQQQSDQSIVAKLVLDIEQDPERRLRDCYPRVRNCHPREHAECCNCQILSQRLLFVFKDPPDKITDIARECKIPYQTLVAHWKRKGIPLLREIVIKHGYQPPTN